jgi:predicted oxidoreductase
MRTLKLGMSGLEVPVIAVGCMRINTVSQEEAVTFLKTFVVNIDLSSISNIYTSIYNNQAKFSPPHCLKLNLTQRAGESHVKILPWQLH